MLENYGYTVLDLGKNVPAEKVVEVVLEKDIRLVGLSALMTTTVMNMEATIKMLRERLGAAGKECKIMVGGAYFSVEPTWMWVKDGKSARILCNKILVTTGCRRFLREGRDGFCRYRKGSVREVKS